MAYEWRDFTKLFILIAATLAACWLAGLDARQCIAATTMFAFIYGTLLFWKMRLGFAFAGIAFLLLSGVLDLPHFLEFASLDIIVFLIGMMLIVGYMEKSRFFEFVLSHILRLAGNDGNRLILLLMLASALFAALVDEVTSILFMVGMVMHLSGKLKLNPVPLLLMTIFATNIGSSATAIGNPVGVMVAFKGGFTFMDFLRWATPVSFASLVALMIFCVWYFRKDIGALGAALAREKSAVEKEKLDNGMVRAGILFIAVILALVLHAHIEGALGLQKNTMLIGTALAGAAVVLFMEQDKARELVETKVDWWTLTFFMLLFASVGALKYVGVTEILTAELVGLSQGNALLAAAAVMLVVGALSAFLDNVLAVAIFIPVVQGMAAAGAGTEPLWWAMLFGGTLFGNLTVVGSTANIVAVGMLERRRGTVISFGEWIKPGLFAVIASGAIAFLALYLEFFLK